MKTADVQPAMKRIFAMMEEKGFDQPSGHFFVQMGYISLTISSQKKDGSNQEFYKSTDSVEECLAAAHTWLAAQPDAASRRRKEIVRLLSLAAEEAKLGDTATATLAMITDIISSIGGNMLPQEAEVYEQPLSADDAIPF